MTQTQRDNPIIMDQCGRYLRYLNIELMVLQQRIRCSNLGKKKEIIRIRAIIWKSKAEI